MACVMCGNRSDCDVCEQCMERMYAEEYQRQMEQEAYEAWCAERENERHNLGGI